MIFSELEVPICKKCQLIDKPCIRCHKVEYTPGKVTEEGPVCNSCSKYFREPKKCEVCHKKTIDTSNRTMENKEVKLICTRCYRKTLPICSRCSKQRKAYTFSLDRKKPICKICSIEDLRTCQQCNKEFPAGMGRLCRDCSYSNTLNRKTKFVANSLSGYFSDVFMEFSTWLVKRRGVEFSAIHIDKYFPYFLELDKLAQMLNCMPTYKDIVSDFTVAATRKNLLVTLFFEDIDLIKVDKEIKEEHANLDMIERYLAVFEEDILFHKIIKTYSDQLFEKLEQKRTSIRSVRLALTPACKYLEYCTKFGTMSVTQSALEGYLWCYPGQRSALTGFINFLRSKYGVDLNMETIQEVILITPRESHQYLKQKFIDILRGHELVDAKKEMFLRNSIEYLHEVQIPNNIYLSMNMIKRNKNKDAYLHVANQKFFLPTEVTEKLLS